MTTQLRYPVGPGDHVLGPEDAPVTLVEYGDFECPHCGRAYPIVERLRQRLGESLRFVYRHFPLSEIHPHAEHAAEMAEAAGERGKFWQMHHMLFEHQDALEDVDLVRYAVALGIDPTWAATALRLGSFAERVREQFVSGVRSGVNGTPTFFVNGRRHDGPWDGASLLQAIQEAALAAARR